MYDGQLTYGPGKPPPSLALQTSGHRNQPHFVLFFPQERTGAVASPHCPCVSLLKSHADFGTRGGTRSRQRIHELEGKPLPDANACLPQGRVASLTHLGVNTHVGIRPGLLQGRGRTMIRAAVPTEDSVVSNINQGYYPLAASLPWFTGLGSLL